MNKNPDLVVFDIECYPNYFLAAFKNIVNNKVVKIELRGFGKGLTLEQRKKLRTIMCTRTTFGYNSTRYDIPMVLAAIQGFDCQKLKKVSDGIIINDWAQWQTLKACDLYLDKRMDTFDLTQVGPGVFTSLKLYGGRLHSPKLQDLPYPPDKYLTESQMDDVSDYCVNDLNTTIDLYNALLGDLDLRHYMSEQYGIDLRSKGGAQITEAIVQLTLGAKSNRKPPPRKVTYKSPKYVRFESEQLTELLDFVNDHEFTVDKSGYVKLPSKLTKPFVIGETSYKMGIGGLHSQEKNLHVENVTDSDVVSYYPSIMLNNNITPPQLGQAFLTFFRTIFDDRILAKKARQMMKSDSLKLILNSAFGKLSNRWSCMYDPAGMLNVTITGQLALLMLIEDLENAGCSVYSANTDGVVHAPGYDKIFEKWENVTGFKLEHTHYKSLHARDVNNYVAIKTDGEVKSKGVFAESGLRKNPAMSIIYKAVVEQLSNGIPVEDTILGCKDPRQFLTVRTVKSGAEWRGKYLGKVVRFYWSTDGEKLVYASNGNKVPTSDGSTPLMEIKEGMKVTIDYPRYIETAKDILNAGKNS